MRRQRMFHILDDGREMGEAALPQQRAQRCFALRIRGLAQWHRRVRRPDGSAIARFIAHLVSQVDAARLLTLGQRQREVRFQHGQTRRFVLAARHRDGAVKRVADQGGGQAVGGAGGFGGRWAGHGSLSFCGNARHLSASAQALRPVNIGKAPLAYAGVLSRSPHGQPPCHQHHRMRRVLQARGPPEEKPGRALHEIYLEAICLICRPPASRLQLERHFSARL
ncbi:hypothetical protein D3C72_1291020 [compost metagenome]